MTELLKDIDIDEIMTGLIKAKIKQYKKYGLENDELRQLLHESNLYTGREEQVSGLLAE